MKYCKKCKHIHDDKFDVCTECRKPQPLYPIEDQNTPIFLIAAGGFEAQRIQSALESAGIPSECAARKNNISADVVTGSDPNDKDILVPFSVYQEAYDVCVGIGAIKPEGEEIKVDWVGDLKTDSVMLTEVNDKAAAAVLLRKKSERQISASANQLKLAYARKNVG